MIRFFRRPARTRAGRRTRLPTKRGNICLDFARAPAHDAPMMRLHTNQARYAALLESNGTECRQNAQASSSCRASNPSARDRVQPTRALGRPTKILYARISNIAPLETRAAILIALLAGHLTRSQFRALSGLVNTSPLPPLRPQHVLILATPRRQA